MAPREKRFIVAKSPITDEYFAGWMANVGDGIWEVVGKKYNVTDSVLAILKEEKKSWLKKSKQNP
jgi:hypothetical protein